MIDYSLSNNLIYAIITSIFLPIYHIALLLLLKEKIEDNITILLIGSILINFLTYFVLHFYKILGSGASQLITCNSYFDSLLYLGFIYIGYIQFYGLIRRGFSIRLLIELYLSEDSLTPTQLASKYCGDQGLDWLLKKRLSGLEKFRLVKINYPDIKLTNNFGIKLSKILLFISKIFGIKFAG